MLIKNISSDAKLTTMIQAYSQADSGFVADKVFPMIKGGKSYGSYFVFDQDEMNADEMQELADGGTPVLLEMNMSEDTFKTKTYSAMDKLTHKEINESDKVLQIEKYPVKRLNMKRKILKERLFAESFFKAGVWGTDKTVTIKWDVADSTPINDISEAILEFQRKTGYTPNKMTVQAGVHATLKVHPQIVERINNQSDKAVTDNQLRGLFEIEEYIVASAISSSNGGGFIFGPHVLLSYSPKDSETLKEPSAGYTIINDKLEGSNGTGEKIVTDKVAGSLQEVVYYIAKVEIEQKLTSAKLGYFFPDVITEA